MPITHLMSFSCDAFYTTSALDYTVSTFFCLSVKVSQNVFEVFCCKLNDVLETKYS